MGTAVFINIYHIHHPAHCSCSTAAIFIIYIRVVLATYLCFTHVCSFFRCVVAVFEYDRHYVIGPVCLSLSMSTLIFQQILKRSCCHSPLLLFILSDDLLIMKYCFYLQHALLVMTAASVLMCCDDVSYLTTETEKYGH